MKKEEKDYLSQYWVGLMDGDGSIQVNHWRKKRLQYRLVIKIKNDPEKLNRSLLERIQKSVGGSVRVEKNGLWVLWVENHRKRVSQIVELLDKYPPLTKRVLSQLTFLKECMRRQCVSWYLTNRGQKYNQPLPRAPLDINEREGWLSGFIEAEGCFALKEGSNTFSIAQKDERGLLERISQHFGKETRVRAVTNKKNSHLFYLLQSSNPLFLRRVVSHCTLFPLYGERKREFLLFSNNM